MTLIHANAFNKLIDFIVVFIYNYNEIFNIGEDNGYRKL